jgi:hypothetical protein
VTCYFHFTNAIRIEGLHDWNLLSNLGLRHGWKILILEDESFGVWAKGGKDVRVWEGKKGIWKMWSKVIHFNQTYSIANLCLIQCVLYWVFQINWFLFCIMEGCKWPFLHVFNQFGIWQMTKPQCVYKCFICYHILLFKTYGWKGANEIDR